MLDQTRHACARYTCSEDLQFPGARAGEWRLKGFVRSHQQTHNLSHLFDRTIGSRRLRPEPGLVCVAKDTVETGASHLKAISDAVHQQVPVISGDEMDKHLLWLLERVVQ